MSKTIYQHISELRELGVRDEAIHEIIKKIRDHVDTERERIVGQAHDIIMGLESVEHVEKCKQANKLFTIK